MSLKEILGLGAKTAAKETVKCNATKIASATFSSKFGRQAGTSVINLSRNLVGKPSIYGGAARNVAGASLKKVGFSSAKMAPGGAVATAVVSLGPDIYRYANGDISGKEFAERTAGNGGALAGSFYGASMGAAFGPVGLVVGTIGGAVVGEQALKRIAKSLF